jgi:tryptophanyl-tRNA synthetase
MSKSDPSDMSRINLADSPDEVMKKVRKAKTDPEPLPSEEGGLAARPEALNLVTIYAALADRSVPEVLQAYGGQGFGAFKQALGELMVDAMAPISARFTALLEDREALDAILARGAAKARQIAGPTLAAAYDALGLLRG